MFCVLVSVQIKLIPVDFFVSRREMLIIVDGTAAYFFLITAICEVYYYSTHHTEQAGQLCSDSCINMSQSSQ